MGCHVKELGAGHRHFHRSTKEAGANCRERRVDIERQLVAEAAPDIAGKTRTFSLGMLSVRASPSCGLVVSCADVCTVNIWPSHTAIVACGSIGAWF